MGVIRKVLQFISDLVGSYFGANKTGLEYDENFNVLITFNQDPMPIEKRDEIEQLLKQFLEQEKLGHVYGTGYQELETAVLSYCVISLHVNLEVEGVLGLIVSRLEQHGVPEGSLLQTTDEEIVFG